MSNNRKHERSLNDEPSNPDENNDQINQYTFIGCSISGTERVVKLVGLDTQNAFETVVKIGSDRTLKRRQSNR